LVVALKERGLKQRDFARLVGDHETVVSRVINGIWNLDEERKIRYAKILKKKPEDLFGE
jgi:transcriptional regulator with XRE-family HTH domain